MSAYQQILVAIDLSAESEQVVEKARQLAAANGARLSLVHVIEPLSYAYGGDLPLDFSGVQEEIQRQAETKIASLGEAAGIPESQRHLLNGRPEHEIHRLTESEQYDLVVIGSHGRHGLGLLLGSTANAVLHGANVDVLAVRIQEATTD